MDKGQSNKKAHSEVDGDELDLTLRLSSAANEEQNKKENKVTNELHDFLGLGGSNSNDEVPPNHYPNMIAKHYEPLYDRGGTFTYGGGESGLFVAPLHPIPEPSIPSSGLTLSSHDQGFLPSSGFATPSRKRPTNESGNICRLCFTRNSLLWRKGPDGPQTLCNKCGLKYYRHLKKGSK